MQKVKCAVRLVMANPFINWSPTKLKRVLREAVGPERRLMEEALAAWETSASWNRLLRQGPVASGGSLRDLIQFLEQHSE